MKNAWKQIGKAVCYVLLYLWIQIAVTIGCMVVYYFMLGIQMGKEGKSTEDLSALMEDVTGMTNAITPWVVTISMVLTLLVLGLFFLIRRKNFPGEIGVKKFAASNWPGVICAAAGLYLTVAFGLELLPLPEEVWESYIQSSEGLAGSSVLLFLSNVIAAPVVEEVIFRGLAFRRMKAAMPVWLAMILSSVMFAVLHGQILWMSYAFLLGMICCLAVHKTGSILASLFIHTVFNLFGSVLAFWTEGIPENTYAVFAAVGLALLTASVVLLWPRKKEGNFA